MERSEILNALLALTEHQRYLEIGVQHGLTFQTVRARRRVAVDPAFLFDRNHVATESSVAPEYHEVTSDRYFRQASVETDVFDVVFIDGLHTFDQTLRDLLNASMHLASDGFLVIDDVLPSNYPASLPRQADMEVAAAVIGETSPAWMGDVYRLVFFIQGFLPGFRYATVAENHGQTILWRGKRDLPEAMMSVEEVARTDYADSLLKRDAFNIMPFADILAKIGSTQ